MIHLQFNGVGRHEEDIETALCTAIYNFQAGLRSATIHLGRMQLLWSKDVFVS